MRAKRWPMAARVVPRNLMARVNPLKRAFQIALHFGRAAIPSAGLGKCGGIILAAQHHDRVILVGLRIAHVAADNVVQHLGKELVMQIVGVESHPGDRGLAFFLALYGKQRGGLIDLLVASRHPFRLKDVWRSLFLEVHQLFGHAS